ncbi:MAG TPA: hypothetical protein VMD52_04205 [Patescibacteria group bacterium]|nr:hypothetical protein [Patescibacteria group bacterium]
MRNVWILFAEVLCIIALWFGVYTIYQKVQIRRFSHRPLVTDGIYLSDADIEEELIFFLSKKLGIYEQDYQVVDVVNLNTREVTGVDYILVTLRAPDGRLCQVIVSRNSNPWAKWELDPVNFNVVDIVEPDSLAGQAPQWMQELSITPEQVNAYYKAHPELAQKGEAAFFDAKTGVRQLPADWYQVIKPEVTFSLEIGKDKTVRIISSMGEEAKKRVVNAYWKADYPTDYLGGGYREYLFRKLKDSQ